MNLEKFKKIIYIIKNQDKNIRNLYKLGVDIINSDIYENFNKITNILFESILTKEGVDLIDWWLYENVDKKIYDNEDSSKIIADLNKIEDLYKYMENERFFKKIN